MVYRPMLNLKQSENKSSSLGHQEGTQTRLLGCSGSFSENSILACFIIVFKSQARCGGTKAAEKHWLQSKAAESYLSSM